MRKLLAAASLALLGLASFAVPASGHPPNQYFDDLWSGSVSVVAVSDQDSTWSWTNPRVNRLIDAVSEWNTETASGVPAVAVEATIAFWSSQDTCAEADDFGRAIFVRPMTNVQVGTDLGGSPVYGEAMTQDGPSIVGGGAPHCGSGDLDQVWISFDEDAGQHFNDWYYGTDGDYGSNETSFVGMLTHELGHGMGYGMRAADGHLDSGCNGGSSTRPTMCSGADWAAESPLGSSAWKMASLEDHDIHTIEDAY